MDRRPPPSSSWRSLWRQGVGACVIATAACGAPASNVHATNPAGPGNATWSYEVVADRGAHELEVVATFTGDTERELTVEQGAEPFVHDVRVVTDQGEVLLKDRRRSWYLPNPCAPRCVVKYGYHLLESARANDEVAVARVVGDAIEAPPSTWLLRPSRSILGTPFRFHVTTAPGDLFVSGVFPDPSAPGTYLGATDEHYQLAYAAFGPLRVREIDAGTIQLAILPGPVEADDKIASWVESAGRTVKNFYGRFPVPRLLILAHPSNGNSVGFGTTMGHSGAAIAIEVGVRSTPQELLDDWVLVHEMVHTALPDLEGPQHWLEEGLATYVEPIARKRAGTLTTARVWTDWIDGMPNGLPEAGDLGLDRTPTWGRTYWGGALFCLLADVEIRKRTGNQRSLADALRAIVASGGNISQSWPVERVLEVGDGATGVPVLRELYGKMANAPMPVDLAALWKALGVSEHGKDVVVDDAAPLAAVRRGITSEN